MESKSYAPGDEAGYGQTAAPITVTVYVDATVIGGGGGGGGGVGGGEDAAGVTDGAGRSPGHRRQGSRGGSGVVQVAAADANIEVPGSWVEFLATVRAKLRIPAIGAITDDAGCRIDTLEGLMNGERLCVVPSLVPGGSSSAAGLASPDSASSAASGFAASPAFSDFTTELVPQDLEALILGRSTVDDFEVLTTCGQAPAVHFVARCTRVGLPDTRKSYVLRLLGQQDLVPALGMTPHSRLCRLWCVVTGVVPDGLLAQIPAASRAALQGAGKSRVNGRFLVMDHHPTSLAQVSAGDREAAGSMQAVVAYGVDILEAVVHLQQQGMIHPGIGLHNVLVDSQGRAVVAGLARAQATISPGELMLKLSPDTPFGSEALMPPEIVNAMRAKSQATWSFEKAAVWNVGCILYELLADSSPFPGYPSSTIAAGNTQVWYDTSTISARLPDSAQALRALIVSLLAVDPTQRPTAENALNTLRAILLPFPEDSGYFSRKATSGSVTSVRVKLIDGRSSVVQVLATDSVIDLVRLFIAAARMLRLTRLVRQKHRAAAALEPSKPYEDYQWMLLRDGRELTDSDNIVPILSKAGPDAVWHLLCVAPQRSAGEDSKDDESFCAVAYSSSAKSKNGHLYLTENDTICTSTKWGSVKLRLRTLRHLKTGVHVWAFKVVFKAPSGGICIGIAQPTFDVTRKNVGAAPGSYGYSSSGKKSDGSPKFVAYAASFGTGDVIRAELDLNVGTLKFYKNGTSLDVAFSGLQGKAWVPALCMGGVRGEEGHQVQIIQSEAEYQRLVSAFQERHEAPDEVEEVNHESSDYAFDDVVKSPRIELLDNGHVAQSTRWGTVVLKYPVIKPGSGLHLFRFRILTKSPRGGVCIGVVNPIFDVTVKNLGAAPNSWGYSSTGKIGSGNAEFEPFGAPMEIGDVVSMVVDSDRGALVFALNGEDQGIAFKGLANQLLRPAVCLGGCDEPESHSVMSMEQVRLFDPPTRSPGIVVRNNGRTATSDKKGIVLLAHSGMAAGLHVWSLHVEKVGQCVGVGVVPAKPTRGSGGERGMFYVNVGSKVQDSSDTPYGCQFNDGDTITVIADMDQRHIRFATNGQDQGRAFTWNTDMMLYPAVSFMADAPARVTCTPIMSYPVSLVRSPNSSGPVDCQFHSSQRSAAVQLSPDRLCASAVSWGSALVDVPPVSGGIHVWRFLISRRAETGGICVGVVKTDFEISRKNVGAAVGSWGYSSSGKKNNGSKNFEAYGESYSSGDVVEVLVDIHAKEISFTKNGVHQGVAYHDLEGDIIPAVCLGGAKIGDQHVVKLLPSRGETHRTISERLIRFSPWMRHRSVTVSDDQLASSMTAWGSVVLEQGGMAVGRHIFKFNVEHKAMNGGICIGLVDNAHFDATSKNVGAASNSWGFASSGKISAGSPQFEEYGAGYATGDIVGIDVDMDAGTVSFSVNDADQGVAFNTGLKGRLLLPAVCAGGATGRDVHRISVMETPVVFDSALMCTAITLSPDQLTAQASAGWGSVCLAHSGMMHGKYSWDLKIVQKSPSGGICIGIVDCERFDVKYGQVGADKHSWGYSSVGKAGDGSGDWTTYAEPFDTGDTITTQLDMNAGTLRFFKNGTDQGVSTMTGLKGKRIMPAVCMGGARTKPHIVQLIPANVQA